LTSATVGISADDGGPKNKRERTMNIIIPKSSWNRRGGICRATGRPQHVRCTGMALS
jgi:hypothetical protein